MKELYLSEEEVVLLDDEDFLEVSQFNWHVLRKPHYTSYAVRNIFIDGRWTSFLMHRMILRVNPDQHIDHIDGNGLNNTRANLRIATRGQNMRNTRHHRNNTSGFRGVCFDRQHQKYRASIRTDGRLKYLGLFLTPEEAHMAYCAAAKVFHKEFARLK